MIYFVWQVYNIIPLKKESFKLNFLPMIWILYVHFEHDVYFLFHVEFLFRSFFALFWSNICRVVNEPSKNRKKSQNCFFGV